jgi:hypothetical protein
MDQRICGATGENGILIDPKVNCRNRAMQRSDLSLAGPKIPNHPFPPGNLIWKAPRQKPPSGSARNEKFSRQEGETGGGADGPSGPRATPNF